MPINNDLKSILLEDLAKQQIKVEERVWSNYMQTLSHPALIVEIDTEEQLTYVVKSVRNLSQDLKDSIHIRAAAGWDDDNSYHCSFWECLKKNHEATYNESFSFSEGAIADIIVQFSKTFQSNKMKIEPINEIRPLFHPNPIKALPKYTVEVKAGTQIGKLATYLEKHHKSLSTVSMIPYVSCVGLAMNAGHGTGRDEPSFAGLIREIKICDHDGNIKILKAGMRDFKTIRAAMTGLFGIVISIKLECVDAFKLKETIHNLKSLSALYSALPKLISDNQYFTLMHVPSSAEFKNWHIRAWNYTEEDSTIHKPIYAPGPDAYEQALTTKLGASVQEYLIDNALIDLLPTYLNLVSTAVTKTRGEKPEVGKENHITHYQAAFPKALHDMSFMIPVNDSTSGITLANHLAKIDELLNQAAQEDDYPVTYAIYARYYQGTNGGLSTSTTHSKNEKTLALEIVTHPDAPGLAEFEAKLISYFNTLGIKPHYHLGKNMPPSVKSYKDFFSREALNEFNMALLNWYGSKENIIHSPFMSPYFQAMLGLDPGVTLDDVTLLAPEKRLKPEHTDKEIRHFLGKLDTLLDSSSNKKIIPKSSPHQKALAQFKEEVSDALEYSKHLSQYPGTAV